MEALEFVDRRGSGCGKWDNQSEMFGENGLLGMWVADMDFKTAACVREALHKAVDQGVYGYNNPSDGYFQAFIDWEERRHGYRVSKDWIRFSPGVVTGFSFFIQLFAKAGEAVLIQPPVYYPFKNAVEANGRKLVCAELVNHGGVYTVDLEQFEKAIVEQNVKAFLLSSPHNPVGRVWQREELRGMLEICRAHGVKVIADEIHHDLVFGDHVHIPTATVGDYDDMVVTLTAPSKTFNLAGCQNSVIIIPDPDIRQAYDTLMNTLHITRGNLFGYAAAEAAYRGGEAWFEAVKETVYGNYHYARARLEQALPKVVISELEGTYLMWLDFRAYLQPDEMETFFQKKCGIAFDYGKWFGGDAACCVRMNLATSRETVELAVKRIIQNLA